MRRFLIPFFSGSALVAIAAMVGLKFTSEAATLYSILDITATAALVVFCLMWILLFIGIMFPKYDQHNE